MSVARACHLEPLQGIPSTRQQGGAGGRRGHCAGMTRRPLHSKPGARGPLGRKRRELGGIARKLHYTLEDLDVQAYLRDLIQVLN